jgi:ribosomal protein S12 methylthiotransferase
MYSYPNSLRQSFLNAMSQQEKICRYIDMPLQHASGPVLARMKRGGNSDVYKKMIDNIRRTVPGVAIRTTFIVGFPGESDADFQELMDFVRQSEFDRVGVFLYSDEESTSGSKLEPKVPYRIKVQRRKELMTLQAGISRKNNRNWIGRQARAIVDGHDSRGILGRLYSQAPDIDGIVRIQGDHSLPGDFLDLQITGAGEYDLSARVL